jgi:hypothetical protein
MNTASTASHGPYSQHHRHQDDRHQPVNHRRNRGGTQRLLDFVDRGEARCYIARMPALEEAERQAQ